MMSARRSVLVLGGTALAAAVAGAFLGALVLQSRSGASELLSASFTDLAGRIRKIREWQGRVVLCNFWATWCEPCRKEVPLLSAAEQQYSPKGATIVGIGIDSADKIAQFAAKYGIQYANLVADASVLRLLPRLGNTAAGLPFSVVLDRSGAIAHRRLGAYDEPELQKVLDSMLR
jgi:thiol-disulfide isomerase/thioredoxin